MSTFVPIEDVAKHLSVSVSTLRSWLRQGHIPEDCYIKVANTYRFELDKLVNYLTQKPKYEAESVAASEPTAQEHVPVQLEFDFNNPDDDL